VKKQRRSRRGRAISDAEIDRLLQRCPDRAPTTAAIQSNPILRRATRADLGLSREDWLWLTKMNAADRPVTGIVDDLVGWAGAQKAHYKRTKERTEAIFLYRRVTELQNLLADEGVAKPQLRAAQYYAHKPGARFKTGGGLKTFVWRTLALAGFKFASK
jgi:hypothetical protein